MENHFKIRLKLICIVIGIMFAILCFAGCGESAFTKDDKIPYKLDSISNQIKEQSIKLDSLIEEAIYLQKVTEDLKQF